MARGITQFDIDRAAYALLAQGECPAVDPIRQYLGTGSPYTVTRTLDAWWKAIGARLAASENAPALVTSQLLEQALAAAREHAEATLGSNRTALPAARLEPDAQVAMAAQAAEAADVRAARGDAVTPTGGFDAA